MHKLMVKSVQVSRYAGFKSVTFGFFHAGKFSNSLRALEVYIQNSQALLPTGNVKKKEKENTTSLAILQHLATDEVT